jgi:hypothetical protein
MGILTSSNRIPLQNLVFSKLLTEQKTSEISDFSPVFNQARTYQKETEIPDKPIENPLIL